MTGIAGKSRLTILALALFCPLSVLAAETAAPVAEPSISSLDNRLQNIERLLQNQGLLDMLQQIRRLQEEVTELRGQIEVNNHELEKLRDRQRKLYNDLDQRLQQAQSAGTTAETESPPLETTAPAGDDAAAGDEAPTVLTLETVSDDKQEEREAGAGTEQAGTTGESAGNGDASPPLESTESEEQAGTAATADPLAAQSEYQEAFNLLRNAEYDRAITEFDKFLSRHPDSQYSDNAQYWMGEAYYVTRRFNEAITEYMKLVSNFPDSQKAPNGLLKIAYSYLEMGQKEEAENAFQDLINRYPDSNAAADAEKRMQNSSS